MDGIPHQDYSLLLGIHIVEEARPAAAVENGDQLPHCFAAYSFEGPGSYQMGIIDPALVSKTALTNAASVAGLMLTTDVLVTELKEDAEPVTGAKS